MRPSLVERQIFFGYCYKVIAVISNPLKMNPVTNEKSLTQRTYDEQDDVPNSVQIMVLPEYAPSRMDKNSEGCVHTRV